MKNTLIKRENKRKNAGFTLLELVVVVAVMGLISTMAMDVYTDQSNQKRFDATKERLAEIKFAIIGDPMMRVGSQAVLTGFFNDMERLPRNLKELIEIDIDNNSYCLHNTDYSIDTSKDSVSCPAGWSWTNDATRGKPWNGPYLSNIQSNGSSLVFQDAWGNANAGSGNFGWLFHSDFSGSTPPGNLSIQSLGLNHDFGGNGYEADYPADPAANYLIHKTELERIMQLKGLVTIAGYCVVVSTAKIDLNYVSQSLCEANNPTPPTTATHLWATFN